MSLTSIISKYCVPPLGLEPEPRTKKIFMIKYILKQKSANFPKYSPFRCAYPHDLMT